jgi:hypothetical protein
MKKGFAGRCRQPLGSCPSLLGIEELDGAYVYHDDIEALTPLVRLVGAHSGRLQWIEAHGLDRHQHWWSDNSERTRDAY